MNRVRFGVLLGGGLLVALALAFFVSPEASSQPDGLDKVAIDEGFADQEETHDLESSPLAGYGVEGMGNDRLSTGLAGITGVLVTFAVGAGLIYLNRHLRRRSTSASEGTETTTVRL